MFIPCSDSLGTCNLKRKFSGGFFEGCRRSFNRENSKSGKSGKIGKSGSIPADIAFWVHLKSHGLMEITWGLKKKFFFDYA